MFSLLLRKVTTIFMNGSLRQGCLFLFFPFFRFYLTEKDSEKAEAGGAADGEAEAGSPLSRGPEGAGLHPRTPGP